MKHLKEENRQKLIFLVESQGCSFRVKATLGEKKKKLWTILGCEQMGHSSQVLHTTVRIYTGLNDVDLWLNMMDKCYLSANTDLTLFSLHSLQVITCNSNNRTSFPFHEKSGLISLKLQTWRHQGLVSSEVDFALNVNLWHFCSSRLKSVELEFTRGLDLFSRCFLALESLFGDFRVFGWVELCLCSLNSDAGIMSCTDAGTSRLKIWY